MAAVVLLILLLGGFVAPQQGDESPLRSCAESFIVHSDKIIRTQDSRALGAKFLTESDVASQEDCLQLCCETPSCDVFVYDHNQRLGSCYLFHCGDEQDFKCKFTEHKNYSSGVLILAPYSELEAQIKLTKHENELIQLRKADETTLAPTTTTTEKVPQLTKATTKSDCNRYQFKCRDSGECIAIYNACDGIPQCPDGSDEGPDCPAIPGTTRSVPLAVHPQVDAKNRGFVMDVKKSGQDYPHQLMNNREYDETGWRGGLAQQRIPLDETNRKEQVNPVEVNDRYYSGHQAPDKGYYGPPNTYVNGDYPKANNGYYGGVPYNWPIHQREDPRWMYPGPPQPDFYYEEGQNRGRMMRPQIDPPKTPMDDGINHEKPKETVSVKKIIPTETTTKTESTTAKMTTHAPLSAKSYGLVMNEDEVVILEADGENDRPRGAILSLAFGMCICAIMITLVGCRLRVVQRRLRRGGKGFAHDADYLVNGMYI